MMSHDRQSDIYDCLCHSYRRYALHCLHEAGEPIALADLAEDVSEQEHEAPVSEINAETVKDVYMMLYHQHIPKLADADLVEYDRERDVVELVAYPTELEASGESQSLATTNERQ